MATEKFANSPTPSTPSTAWATITAGINSSVTALALSTLSPFPATVQFRILIDDELMLVTALPGGLAATVTRGVEGTTAASHASGASVYHVLSAAALTRSPRSMTTLGDIEYLDANGAPARLSIGSVGQVFTVAGGLPSWASPVSLANQNANLIFAGPATGAAAAPTFRAMVAADLGTTLEPTFGNLILSGTSPVLLTFSGAAADINAKFVTKGAGVFYFGDIDLATYYVDVTIWLDTSMDPFTYAALGGAMIGTDASNYVGVGMEFTSSAPANSGHHVEAIGANLRANHRGSGVLDFAIGVETAIGGSGGGTITDGRAIWIKQPSSFALGNTITHLRGLRIESFAAVVGSTTNYPIDYAGLFFVASDGKVDAPAYKVGGVAGVSFGPAPVASITVVNGIVTAIS